MSDRGTNTDRIAALETTVDEQSRDIDTLEGQFADLESRVAELQGRPYADTTAADRIVELERRLAELEAAAKATPTPPGRAAPGQQDTASDLASLDAWLIAQTGVSLEYQLQRMCSQFYGNPLMPPS